MYNYQEQFNEYRDAVENYLQQQFTQELSQKRIFDAMRYSLLAGGKRIRPILVLEFCRVCGGNWKDAIPYAAAIEMIHTYSLIHDDLPCMDNDDYRRGRLTNHKIFGEAMAVLAGDGLLTAAFETIAGADMPADISMDVVRILSGYAGCLGMVGGQTLDIEYEGQELGEEGIVNIHDLKTAALITAACQMGVAAARGTNEQMDAAGKYAKSIGLAFQIRDDMLDVLGDSAKLGKATNHDGNKNTFVKLYGVGTCSNMIQTETENAVHALECFADGQFLREMAHHLALRDN